MFTTSIRPKNFGQGGVILRARATDTLTLDMIREKIPSVFAEHAHESRSVKYSYIPTYQLLERMMKEGFCPVEVRQGGSKNEEKRAFTKHMIRFRHASVTPIVGDTFLENIVINAHDGTSCWETMGGPFRLVCSNGMVVSAGETSSFKVPHRGNVDDVIEASFEVVKDFPRQQAFIEESNTLQLTGPEQEAFASAALSLRFDESQVSPAQILAPRRSADNGNDLWRTLNRVQENVLTGGVRTLGHDQHGRITQRRSRAVNSIADNVRLNQALWALAESMKQLKMTA